MQIYGVFCVFSYLFKFSVSFIHVFFIYFGRTIQTVSDHVLSLRVLR